MSSEEDTLGELHSKPSQGAIKYSARRDSFSSLSSVYSADGGQADYRITGSVQLGLWHRNDTLFIRIVQAKGLAGAKAGGLSDPYVKTYILPDSSKLTKRKTTIQRKTNDPTYDEILKNKLPRCDVGMSTLWLSIWDWDRFGRNLFLGEVRLPLSMDLTNSTDRWYKLKEKKHEPEDEDKGSLTFSIQFAPYSDPRKGSFFIKIKEAKGLPQMNPMGLTDSAVRIFLLPKKTPFSKHKTTCANNTLDPVWNEQFEYKYVALEELRTSRVLELTVWDYDRRGCNDFIGCVRIGPTPDETNSVHKDWMDSTESEAEHWAKMLTSPGEWVECCLKLRPSIISRFAERPSFHEDSDCSIESSEDDDGDSDDDDDSDCGSNLSLYSECETRGDYPITGSLQVRLELKKSSLRVHVVSAKNLAAADSNGFSDPYVKMYLLPDKSKQSKRKTDVKMKTLNPVFNEIMKYEVDRSKLLSHTLWFSVWDWDRFGKNEFLGEVKVPLTESNLNSRAQFYDLSDSSDVGASKASKSVGMLTMGLKFEELGTKKGETYGKLHIHIRKAKDLPNMDTHGYTDGFVKIFLLPTKSSKAQRKTKVIKDNLDPIWNETFVYDKVTVEQLSYSHALEVTVWDQDMISSNDFVGGLRIGPEPKLGQTKNWMDSNAMEFSHWEEMLSCPGEWVERCHTLRASMEYRDISIPEEPPAPLVQAPAGNTNISVCVTDGSASVEDELSTKMSISESSHDDSHKQNRLHRASPIISMKGHHLSRRNQPPSVAEPSPKQDTQAQLEEKERRDLGETAAPASVCAFVPSGNNEEFRELTQDSKSSSSIGSTQEEKISVADGDCPPASNMTNGDYPAASIDEIDGEISPESADVSNKESSHAATATLDVPSEKIESQSQMLSTSIISEREVAVAGYLTIAIMFRVTKLKSKIKGNLHVKIKEAHGLQCKTKDGIFAKVRLLPPSTFSSSKKTKTIKKTASPSWNQTFVLDKYFLDEISSDRVLEVTLWDNNNGSNRLFVGGVRLGPSPKQDSRRWFAWMDSSDKEIEHWESVFAKHGTWVEIKHSLRASMNY